MSENHLFFLLCLLLPLAFFSGWWVSKRSKRDQFVDSTKSINPNYFRGLNYVLNEQPDKAIEVFVKLLKVDSETIETHLALLELGMDYMRSGLLDRAEGLFKQLMELGDFESQASRQLLDIYQQEKDWDNAIVYARRLEATSSEKLDKVIAQFYCELVEECLSAGNVKNARENFRKALNIDPRCVRASILEADLLQSEKKFKSAIKAYKRIEKQDVEYLSEVIEPMLICYRELGKTDDAIFYLKEVMEKYGGITPMLFSTELMMEHEDKEESIKFLSAELCKRPTVKGVNRLLEYAMDKASGEVRDSLGTIKEMAEQLLENNTVYKCLRYGFDAKLLHWQCLGCKNWIGAWCRR